MTKHGKKMIAPVIITILFCMYFIGYAILVFSLEPPWYVCILGVIIPVCLAGVLIAMMLERMKEIRSGEEDDLSKY